MQAWAWLWPGPRTPAALAQQKQVHEAGLPRVEGPRMVEVRRVGGQSSASPAEAEPQIKEPGVRQQAEAAPPSPALSPGRT